MIRAVILLIAFSGICYGQGLKFVTDFETTQWDANGSTSTWELGSNDEVRVVSDAYEGSRAIWLGSFNNDATRNEINNSVVATTSESWVGFAMKIVTPGGSSRPYAQFRPLRVGGGVGAGVTNVITIRQGSSPGKAFINTSTIEENVDVIYTSGANPSGCCDATNFDYVVGEWFSIVIHWVLDPVNGQLEIWKDGNLIFSKTGTTIYRYAHVDGEAYGSNLNITVGPYWSSNLAPVGDVYYDKYSLWEGTGGSYEKVHPLGLSPGAGGGTPPIIPTTGAGKQKTQTAQLISN